MSSEERELLDAELQREIAAAMENTLAGQIDKLSAAIEALAGVLIDELRKRRIVLYRRATHRLPDGLHQVTLDELETEVAGGPVSPEDPPAGSGATDRDGVAVAERSLSDPAEVPYAGGEGIAVQWRNNDGDGWRP